MYAPLLHRLGAGLILILSLLLNPLPSSLPLYTSALLLSADSICMCGLSWGPTCNSKPIGPIRLETKRDQSGAEFHLLPPADVSRRILYIFTPAEGLGAVTLKPIYKKKSRTSTVTRCDDPLPSHCTLGNAGTLQRPDRQRSLFLFSSQPRGPLPVGASVLADASPPSVCSCVTTLHSPLSPFYGGIS